MPGGVESVDVSAGRLVVGTSDGQLLLYRSHGSNTILATNLVARRGLGCGKKPVERVAILGDVTGGDAAGGSIATGAEQWLALCDACVHVGMLRDGELLPTGSLPSSKGATALCVLTDGLAGTTRTLAVCVGLRRRLHLYLPPATGTSAGHPAGTLVAPDARHVEAADALSVVTADDEPVGGGSFGRVQPSAEWAGWIHHATLELVRSHRNPAF